MAEPRLSHSVGEGLLRPTPRSDSLLTLDHTIARLVELDVNGLCLQWRTRWVLVEPPEPGGLDAIGQDPRQQPARQVGGRSPAHPVAPLQTKAIHIELDEPGDRVIEREEAVGSRRRSKQTFADAVR